ncbi:LamG domain-containing protein [Kitasatospora sp. NPDC001175]|uniref:LamG domain-containing protein n=1 Tax=Kitasatospora sp. NPDC001175 TaxID=3157103 RepID=UPI003D0311FD
MRGHGGRWRADMPGRAYAFDGQGRFLALPAEQVSRAATAGDLTLEAWINPERVEGPVRLLHANAGDTPYGLGLVGGPAVTALAYDGVSAAAVVPGAFGFGDGDFTVEFWARRTTINPKAHYLLGHSTEQQRNSESLHIGFRSNSSFTFAFCGDDLTTDRQFVDTEWHHWACVFQSQTRQQVIYLDGQEIARRTATATYRGQGRLSFASVPCWPGEFASVHLDEVRLWSTARGGDDVRAAMKRRLTGAEAGLLGYWAYSAPAPGAQPVLTDRSGSNRHAELRGKPGPVPARSPIDEGGYRAVATVGDRRVVSRESFPLREWSHLAAAYQQSWAVRLDGEAYLEVADDDTLDIADDLTLEVFARLERLGETQGLLSKGRTADGAGGCVPYRLAVLPDGRLEFAFEEPDGRAVRFTSTEGVEAGTFHRIAVVRKGGRSMQEQKGTRQISAVGADGKPVTQSVELVESVEVREWQDVRFHLDGREIGAARYEGPGPRGNDAHLELGRARDGSTVQPLTGVLAEVRIWGAARDAARLGTAVTARDRGLVAHWRFEENAGSTAADATGSHPARLRGARWVRNPDPRGSVFRLYRNGVSVACDPAGTPGTPDTAAFADPGDAQLTLGAVVRGGKAVESFDGVLEEVRIWRTARTHEQLLDNLFTRLKGEKEDLVAYWPFDRDSTEPDVAQVRDDGLLATSKYRCRSGRSRRPPQRRARRRRCRDTEAANGRAEHRDGGPCTAPGTTCCSGQPAALRAVGAPPERFPHGFASGDVQREHCGVQLSGGLELEEDPPVSEVAEYGVEGQRRPAVVPVDDVLGVEVGQRLVALVEGAEVGVAVEVRLEIGDRLAVLADGGGELVGHPGHRPALDGDGVAVDGGAVGCGGQWRGGGLAGHGDGTAEDELTALVRAGVRCERGVQPPAARFEGGQVGGPRAVGGHGRVQVLIASEVRADRVEVQRLGLDDREVGDRSAVRAGDGERVAHRLAGRKAGGWRVQAVAVQFGGEPLACRHHAGHARHARMVHARHARVLGVRGRTARNEREGEQCGHTGRHGPTTRDRTRRSEHQQVFPVRARREGRLDEQIRVAAPVTAATLSGWCDTPAAAFLARRPADPAGGAQRWRPDGASSHRTSTEIIVAVTVPRVSKPSER